MKNRLLSALAIIGILLFVESDLYAVDSIEGLWRITKITTTTSQGDNTSPHMLPSMFIFTKKHYSIIWMPGKELPQNYEKRWRPTDEEKVQSYNSIIVNAGTYDVDGNVITTKPAIAKTPDFIGGYAKFEYELKDNILKLTRIETMSNDGIQDAGALQVKTTLVLERIKE